MTEWERTMTTAENPDSPGEKSVCTCTHPTHFLGRCQVAVDPPEQLCAECMENHFHRADDPAI
jgi:hypothetical protein